MQPARRFGIAYRFLYRHRERDHVMANLRFQFIDTRYIDAPAFAQLQRRFARYDAGFRQRFGGGQLHFEPFLKSIFVAPDAAHFRACVSRDQIKLLFWRRSFWRNFLTRLF